jgi:hypothetical protein
MVPTTTIILLALAVFAGSGTTYEALLEIETGGPMNV